LILQKIFSVFCICLLTACSSLPSGGIAPAEDDSSAENANPTGNALPSEDSQLVLETVAFAQRVVSASAEEQRQQMAAAAKAYARERSTASRLRYGVLLSLPTLAGADAQRAQAILEPLSTSGSMILPVRQLATLVVLQLNERVKEQRRAQQLKEQLDESRASERVLNERALQLKAQLDELRAIERTLIERGRPRK
jgi:hypothetical protein